MCGLIDIAEVCSTEENANYYKVDINKVKNNTILLDSIVNLSWNIIDGILDAVTVNVPNPPIQGLNICEMAVIVVITKNCPLLDDLIQLVNACTTFCSVARKYNG